ncbi:MAG: uroporphyrinogen-III synthase [Candidatus Sericytochromatia bacterium]|nr:uroporphyrinogen-III synthase [Candidatus Tanganyikabacteria bacterium]
MSLPVLLPADGQRAERWMPVFDEAGFETTTVTLLKPESLLGLEGLARCLAGREPDTWLVLGSASALGEVGPDGLRHWSGPVLAVGRRTAEAARRVGATDVRLAGADTGLRAALEALPWMPGQRVLWLRGEEVAVDVAAVLAPKGVQVEAVTTYRMRPEPAGSRILEDWTATRSGRPGWFVATSPATARTALGYVPWPWRDVSVVALGETTEAALAALGVPVRAVAKAPTAEGVRDAIVRGC